MPPHLSVKLGLHQHLGLLPQVERGLVERNHIRLEFCLALFVSLLDSLNGIVVLQGSFLPNLNLALLLALVESIGHSNPVPDQQSQNHAPQPVSHHEGDHHCNRDHGLDLFLTTATKLNVSRHRLHFLSLIATPLNRSIGKRKSQRQQYIFCVMARTPL